MGWNYAMQWLVVLPLELSAAAIVVDYWKSGVSDGVFITVFFIGILVINLFGVRGYGEAEFFFSVIKVTHSTFLITDNLLLVRYAPSWGSSFARS